MINLSRISNRSILGRLLRLPLGLIPNGIVLPILQGRLRGKKWMAGSSNHGCWLGSYEYEKQNLFVKAISEGSVVYDIGAHVGFYTLLASEIVGPRGRVVAFEPLPRNVHYLKEHLQLNQCDNVTVVEAAVAERSGIAFFQEGTNCSEGHLSLEGRLTVKVVSLDDLVSSGEIPPPDYMKIDIEGGELLALLGVRETLTYYHPTIFLATHGIETHQKCCEFLKSIGYEIQSIDEKDKNKTDEILAFKKKG